MKRTFEISPSQLTALGFLLIILLGASLLCLPFASNDGNVKFVDALFTATSATCVTGLVTLTTATQWTLFGKIIIILLIQTGGLGFMTFISLSAIIAKRNLGLHERKIIMQSSGSLELSEIIKLIKHIAIGTFAFEGVGALILFIRFRTLGHGFITALWYGVFHSISAFCNAGFDILGSNSLIDYQSDPLVLITVSLLVIIGGIGFIVWKDISTYRLKFQKYRLHSKIVLVTTGILLVFGTLFIYSTERNGVLSSLSEGDKWLNAFFQSVTLRTAGFDTIGQGALSTGGTTVSIVLMMIGGSPGSTAGGIKTVAIAVAVLNAISFARNKDNITIFKKRIHDSTVKHACSIITIYLLVALMLVAMISVIEAGKGFTLEDIAFEVSSALGTVGLTRGITPLLSAGSKLILCFAMYFGRLGGLTLLLAIAETPSSARLERPYEKILIG